MSKNTEPLKYAQEQYDYEHSIAKSNKITDIYTTQEGIQSVKRLNRYDENTAQIIGTLWAAEWLKKKNQLHGAKLVSYGSSPKHMQDIEEE